MRRRRLRSEPHTLAGAYALDALSDAERELFERHLARCPACARELVELREATARLAGAAAMAPPDGLVERILVAAELTPQLPPTTRAPALQPLHRVVSLAAALLVLIAAASAAVLGLVALSARHQLSAVEQRDHAIARVLTAPDAVLLIARVRAGGTATVVMSRHDRCLVVTTSGLPTLPPGRSYEVWLMGPSGDRPTGLLPAPREGMTSPVIASGLAEGDWLVLTVEPGGGTPRPTTPPILMLSLAT
jgi:anti-sigma-K factor RskA